LLQVTLLIQQGQANLLAPGLAHFILQYLLVRFLNQVIQRAQAVLFLDAAFLLPAGLHLGLEGEQDFGHNVIFDQASLFQ